MVRVAQARQRPAGSCRSRAEQALEHRLLRAVLLGRRALGAFIGAERDLDLLGLAVAVHVERHLAPGFLERTSSMRSLADATSLPSTS